MSPRLEFIEITECKDDLLIPWLELYETAFPPEERMLASSFLELVKGKSKGEWQNAIMQAVTDDDRFVGLLRYDLVEETCAAYLWYLAVHPDVRSRGIGSKCFSEVVRRASQAHLRAVIFEVEIPEETEDPHRQEYAVRRIAFYHRQGCKILGGIRYLQRLPYQPEIPMHIMVCPIEPVTAREAFQMANALLEDVTQIDELELF